MKGSRRSRVSVALAVGVLVLSLYFLAYLALTSYEPPAWPATPGIVYHHMEPGPNRLLGVVFAPFNALFEWRFEVEFAERPRDLGLHGMGPRMLAAYLQKGGPWWFKLEAGGPLLLVVCSAAFLVFKGIRLRRIFVSRRMARGFPVVTSEPRRSRGAHAGARKRARPQDNERSGSDIGAT